MQTKHIEAVHAKVIAARKAIQEWERGKSKDYETAESLLKALYQAVDEYTAIVEQYLKVGADSATSREGPKYPIAS